MFKASVIFLVACVIITTSVKCAEANGSDDKTNRNIAKPSSARLNRRDLRLQHIDPCSKTYRSPNNPYQRTYVRKDYPSLRTQQLKYWDAYNTDPNYVGMLRSYKNMIENEPRERSLKVLRQFYPQYDQGYPQSGNPQFNQQPPYLPQQPYPQQPYQQLYQQPYQQPYPQQSYQQPYQQPYAPPYPEQSQTNNPPTSSPQRETMDASADIHGKIGGSADSSEGGSVGA